MEGRGAFVHAELATRTGSDDKYYTGTPVINALLNHSIPFIIPPNHITYAYIFILQ